MDIYVNCINPLNTKLNPICHLLALLGAHPILHVSRIRVNIGVKKTARISWLAERFGCSREFNYVRLVECPISIPYKEN
jgi:hypothetical protein